MRNACAAAAELDLSGLHCPWSVLRCKAALQRLQPGAELTITTDNTDATRDVHLLVQRGAVQFLAVHCDERGCHFKVRVGHRTDCLTRMHGPRSRRAAIRRALRRWLTAHEGVPAVD